MTKTRTRGFLLIIVIITFTAISFGQNKFEGYSFVLEADESASCPVRFLPGAGGGNSISVFVAGTRQRTPATNLSSCDGAGVTNNKVQTNGLGKWCFEGPEPFYEITLSTGAEYIWYPNGKESGFFNVKDFRPVTRTTGPTPQYVFEDPLDYTQTIKKALYYVASRQGGTLRFPEGDYVVGTTDGNRRDPSFKGLALGSGTVIEGASANFSTPSSNLPNNRSSSRVRLRNDNQSIFRIGGCTMNIAIKNLELVGNEPVQNEGRRSATNTYGIEAIGGWTIDPRTKASNPNSSLVFKFSDLTIQGFDRGIYVHNANSENCDSARQACGQWQFDYVSVDQILFSNNKTAIWMDTFNTDWKISNSVIAYIANNAPGDGIRIQRAATVQVEQVFAGGGDYQTQIGGTFLNIDAVGALTVISSAAERSKRSIYTNPAGAASTTMINVIGSVFGDSVELNGRINFISSGSMYLGDTIKADKTTNIVSNGDRFCHDSLILPGTCRNQAGALISNPGITGGRVMFRSGRVGEGTGTNRLDSYPNFFGYTVAIGDGLLQMDPNIGFRDIQQWANGVDGRPRITDGAIVFCKDCRRSPNGTCSQGTAGQDGAFAKRINNQWRCD